MRGRQEIRIYDPTSGSGSLLINIGAAVGKYLKGNNRIIYYAQELKENTYNLTRMNLVMRGIDLANIYVRNGDTLEEDWSFFKEGGYQALSAYPCGCRCFQSVTFSSVGAKIETIYSSRDELTQH